MNKKYCIRTLKFLKARVEINVKLANLGVNLTELDESVFNCLIEAICIVVNPKFHKEIKDWTEWWLFEDVEKIITTDNVPENVESVEQFTDFLFKYY